MTKALAVVVSLYYLLVSGSVEYFMPYASCLWCCVVLLCCVCLCCSSGCSPLLQLSLSSCVLKGALLVPTLLQLGLSEDLSFCSLFYLVHSCDAFLDSLSRLMHSGIACLASQAPNWAVAFCNGLSGL